MSVIESLLKDLNIHVSTFDDGCGIRSLYEGSRTKNLFLIDKQHGLFLITTMPERDINLKIIGNLLGLYGSKLRFVDEDFLMDKLKINGKLLNPFALINDTENNITCCIDNELLNQSFIHIRPLQYDRTTSITPTDLLAFLEHVNHKPTILTFRTY